MQGPRKSPEEIQASAQASIVRLERALAFLDESDVFAREALEGSLKRARSQAATVPVQDRLKSCEEFVLRAQKRVSQAEVAVTGAVEHRDRMKEEFEEGHRRLANLQAEAQNTTPLAPIPPVGEMEAVAGTCGRVGRDQCCTRGPRVRQRVSSISQVGFLPPMPTLVPGELFTWLEDRQADLQDALRICQRPIPTPIFETLVALVVSFFPVVIETLMNSVLPVPSLVGERGRTSVMKKRSNGAHCLFRLVKQTRVTMIDPGFDDCI